MKKKTWSIYKYPLKMQGEPQEVLLPENSKLLSVQVQAGIPMLWVLQEKNAPTTCTHWIQLVGTGWPINEGQPEEWAYLGTTQLEGYVWHWFHVN